MNYKPTCPINWDILPQWAQFISIDCDGEIYFWDKKPETRQGPDGIIWKNVEANYVHIGTLPFIPDDFYSFENIWQRPKQQ